MPNSTLLYIPKLANKQNIFFHAFCLQGSLLNDDADLSLFQIADYQSIKWSHVLDKLVWQPVQMKFCPFWNRDRNFTISQVQFSLLRI